MIRVEVIGGFTLEKFNELKKIVRKGVDKDGELFVGDVFECNQEMADYLLGNNRLNREFVKVIEVIPEAVKEEKQETKAKNTKRTTSKKTTAKK